MSAANDLIDRGKQNDSKRSDRCKPWLRLALKLATAHLRVDLCVQEAALAIGLTTQAAEAAPTDRRSSLCRTNPRAITMPRYYIFCRFWPGFWRSFPFHEFDHVHDIEVLWRAIADRVRQGILKDPQRRQTWLNTLCATAGSKFEQWEQDSEYFERCLSAPLFPLKTCDGIHPSPAPALSLDQMFGIALQVLGWRETHWWKAQPVGAVSILGVMPLYVIAAAESEQHAIDLAQWLDKRGHGPYATSFFYEPADAFDSATRAEKELELKALRESLDMVRQPEEAAGDRIQADCRSIARRARALLDEMGEVFQGDAALPAPEPMPASPPQARRRPTLTKDEANITAREFLVRNPKATARDLSRAIGCSLGMVSSLPSWQAVQEQRAKGREPKQPKVVSLTRKMQQATGVEDSQLAKLINEQRADAEPSPLDDDAPDSRDEGSPRKAKVYRRP
jgi:hypothetical protein